MKSVKQLIFTICGVLSIRTEGFVHQGSKPFAPIRSLTLFAADEKMAKEVNGEELELMLTDWDMPLVVDAYATW